MTEPAPPKRSRRALAWVSSTYLGEGLPWSVLHQMGTEFVTARGGTPTQIGATSWFHLAVTFKFLWSPIVDLFGTKRGWVVTTQLALGAGMLVLAGISPAPGPGFLWFWAAASLFAIVHATHDIACDGFYMQALNKHDQSLYSGVRTAAFKVATIVGASGLVVLAGRTSWVLGFGAAGVLMIAVALLNGVIMPKPSAPLAPAASGEAGPPRASGRRLLELYKTFFVQPQAALVLAFMFLYRLGDIMMFAMAKPLLRDMGVDTASRGLLNGIGSGSTIIGALVGGAIIARKGLPRTLIPITYLQNFAIPLYFVMAVVRPAWAGIVSIVLVEQFAAGVGASAQTVFLMQRSRGVFSASHYALATAIVSLGSALSGVASGRLDEHFGHPIFFAIAFVASWPALVLVWFVPKKPLEAA